MATKADFTQEEWALLAKAPFMTGMLVSIASPSGLSGVLSESLVVTKALMSAESDPGTSPLIKDLVADIKATRGEISKSQGLTRDNAKQSAKDTLSQVVSLLSTKSSPEDAASFKEWLKKIAQTSAEAAKEGGFLGFGGETVTSAEKDSIAEIGQILA